MNGFIDLALTNQCIDKPMHHIINYGNHSIIELVIIYSNNAWQIFLSAGTKINWNFVQRTLICRGIHVHQCFSDILRTSNLNYTKYECLQSQCGKPSIRPWPRCSLTPWPLQVNIVEQNWMASLWENDSIYSIYSNAGFWIIKWDYTQLCI